jgi:hypothetical protein
VIFECHITVSTKHSEMAAKTAKELHWKTSEIARDPVLGDDTFFYLTTHSDNLPEITGRMKRCVFALEFIEVEVLREKIELILHDTKVKS